MEWSSWSGTLVVHRPTCLVWSAAPRVAGLLPEPDNKPPCHRVSIQLDQVQLAFKQKKAGRISMSCQPHPLLMSFSIVVHGFCTHAIFKCAKVQVHNNTEDNSSLKRTLSLCTLKRAGSEYIDRV